VVRDYSQKKKTYEFIRRRTSTTKKKCEIEAGKVKHCVLLSGEFSCRPQVGTKRSKGQRPRKKYLKKLGPIRGRDRDRGKGKNKSPLVGMGATLLMNATLGKPKSKEGNGRR